MSHVAPDIVLVKKHALWTRWFHWVNFPVLALMVWSGILVYWANDVYALRWGDTVFFKFFPEPFYQALKIPGRLAEGLAWHLVIAWLFMANGALYVLVTILTGDWKELAPRKGSFKRAVLVALHDLKIIKTAPAKEKFNDAQRLAYTGVIAMGAGSTATGLAIYKPVQLGWLTALCGGYETARLVHFVLTVLYVLFFVVHLAQVARSGWNNFRAMVTGYELAHVEEK